MSSARERTWVGLLNSQAWRRFARASGGSRIIRSKTFRYLDEKRRYVRTAVRQLRDPSAFETVETSVIFLGHVKSGGSLLGALLDAHPDAVMADEIDILRYVEAGFGRDQIFHLLVRGARFDTLKGRMTARRLEPYSLAVPNQWQGRYRTVRVIGESRAGPTTRRLGQNPAMLDRLHDVMHDTNLRFIHVVRRPNDPIAAMVQRSGKSVEEAFAEYAQRCDVLLRLRASIAPAELFTVHYEDLVSRPGELIREVCGFVGLEASPQYLEACAGMVRTDRPAERDAVTWPDDVIQKLEHLIGRIPFLNPYVSERPGEIAWRTS